MQDGILSLPTNSKVVNFIWIGERALPTEELRTLRLYATFATTMPVILWADNPEKMRNQFRDQHMQKLLDEGKIQIRPISDAFQPEEDAQELDKKYDFLIDAIQSREAAGEGNIGTRVDYLKFHLVNRVGGITLDFDTAKEIIDENFRNYTENKYDEENEEAVKAGNTQTSEQYYQDITQVMSIVWEEFNLLTETTHGLNFNTGSAQPDFIVSKRRHPDSQLLREEMLRTSFDNATSLRNNSLFDKSFVPSPAPNELLKKRDPIIGLSKSSNSSHDVRRSHVGWLYGSAKQEVLKNDTGAILRDLISVKRTQLISEDAEFKNFDDIFQQIVELDSQGEDIPQEMMDEYLSLAQKVSEKLNCDLEHVLEKIPAPSLDQLIEASFNVLNLNNENFIMPESIFKNSWVPSFKQKPLGYTQEGKVYPGNEESGRIRQEQLQRKEKLISERVAEYGQDYLDFIKQNEGKKSPAESERDDIREKDKIGEELRKQDRRPK